MFLFKKAKKIKKEMSPSSKSEKVAVKSTSMPTIHEKTPTITGGRHLSVSVSSTPLVFNKKKMNELDNFLIPTFVLHDFEDEEECKVARMIFQLAHVPYDFKRVQRDDYILEDYPYYALPMLEVNQRKFGSVLSICRHLAWRYNFSGKTAIEDAQVDDIAEKVFEIRIKIKNWIDHIEHTADHECDEICTNGEATIILTQKLFPILEKLLPSSSATMSTALWLVGHSMTWVDLLVACLVNPIIYHRPKLLEKFPLLYLHNQNIANIEELAGFFYHVRKRQFQS